ncbi:hypothetical protein [Streptomyces sp. NPDC001980]|uniref:hypothetical protein n=1 Tax=Streptomyces sp. NPDC001980 TaxID=3157126 RepID=UPI00333346A2
MPFSYRFGSPVATHARPYRGGTGGYGSGPAPVLALHNTAGTGGYVVTVPDLCPDRLLAASK